MALAMAFVTAFLHHFARTAATVTNRLLLHGAKERVDALHHPAAAMAFGARLDVLRRLRSGAVTVLAGFFDIQRHGFGLAMDGIHEVDRHLPVMIFALHRLVGPASGLTAPEHASEEVLEAIAAGGLAEQVVIVESAGTTACEAAIHACKAEAVVVGAFLFVTQHFVGFVDFLEFVLGIRFLVHIRMIFHGELAVGFLDFVIRSVLRNS